MSEWKDKSDFEINRAVARLLDGLKDKETAVDCYLSSKSSNCVKWYKEDFDDPSEYELFNPCNNPSDAWPIIVESQISIFNYDNDLWSAQKWIGNKRIANEFIRGGNVLRAAMIVYLEMNGVKP